MSHLNISEPPPPWHVLSWMFGHACSQRLETPCLLMFDVNMEAPYNLYVCQTKQKPETKTAGKRLPTNAIRMI